MLKMTSSNDDSDVRRGFGFKVSLPLTQITQFNQILLIFRYLVGISNQDISSSNSFLCTIAVLKRFFDPVVTPSS